MNDDLDIVTHHEFTNEIDITSEIFRKLECLPVHFSCITVLGVGTLTTTITLSMSIIRTQSPLPRYDLRIS